MVVTRSEESCDGFSTWDWISGEGVHFAPEGVGSEGATFARLGRGMLLLRRLSGGRLIKRRSVEQLVVAKMVDVECILKS